MNALSFFDGATPDGAWNLFVMDDNAAGYVGFGIKAWVLTLEVQPPVTPPAAPPITPQATGKRAAALAKCKKKRKKRARRSCRHKARSLPR